jgi:hypothetical protein
VASLDASQAAMDSRVVSGGFLHVKIRKNHTCFSSRHIVQQLQLL